MVQFNSSWCTRVRRDDLLTVQVDGDQRLGRGRPARSAGSSAHANTPKPVWNPDIAQPIDFYEAGKMCRTTSSTTTRSRSSGKFISHVVLDTPWKYSLMEGAKGVQLAELGMQSWKERRWVDVDDLET